MAAAEAVVVALAPETFAATLIPETEVSLAAVVATLEIATLGKMCPLIPTPLLPQLDPHKKLFASALLCLFKARTSLCPYNSKAVID